MERERRIILILKDKSVNCICYRFTFSFAWTLCIGPVLSTVVLIMASGAKTSFLGICLY